MHALAGEKKKCTKIQINGCPESI